MLLAGLILVQAFAPARTPRAQTFEREVVLRFLPPHGPVEGYRVLLTNEATLLATVLDVGWVAPDADGVGSTAVMLDDAAYLAAMTAYNQVGESPPSNQIRIAEVCDPALCDDGNACTADSCDPSGCLQTPLPDGSACDDGSAATQGDRCVAGACAGVAPTLAVLAVAPNVVSPGTVDLQIHGIGFSNGAVLRFENGEGSAPRVRSLLLLDPQTLAARIEVRAKRPARTRYWDVVVSLPNGNTARLIQGLRVDP
jgi:hypothetical protein